VHFGLRGLALGMVATASAIEEHSRIKIRVEVVGTMVDQ